MADQSEPAIQYLMPDKHPSGEVTIVVDDRLLRQLPDLMVKKPFVVPPIGSVIESRRASPLGESSWWT
jgi:hypothetical protein